MVRHFKKVILKNYTKFFLIIFFLLYILEPVLSQKNCNGSTDTRWRTYEKAVGRLTGGVGGTAWITPSGLLVTAGHCDVNTWVEFNVKTSEFNGNPVPSDEVDRYQIKEWIYTSGNHKGADASIGNDWAVFSVYKNSITGKYPIEAQNTFLEPAYEERYPQNVLLIGYGVDGPGPNDNPPGNYGESYPRHADNQTQQSRVGVGKVGSENILKVDIFNQSGDSGGPLINLETGKVVGIYTHGQCNFNSENIGNVRGTKINQNILDHIYPLTVTLNQKDSSGSTLNGTQVGRWRLSSFSNNSVWDYNLPTMQTSGATVEILRADQSLHSSEKYHHWDVGNTEDNDVKNHHRFEMASDITMLTSVFRSAHNATIQAQLEGVTIGGYLNFQDPWFIDYADLDFGNNLRNRGLEALFYQVTSSTSNIGIGSNYNGVFLNQIPDPNNSSISYYSICAPITQPISNITSYFIGWGIPTNATLAQIGSSPSGYDQKAVVFTGENSVVTANYKGSFVTNNAHAIYNSSQQKTIRIGSRLFFVYESMGYVWCETSTDDGVTWSLLNNNQPISGYGGRLPSLASATFNGGAQALLIAYQEGNNVKVKCFAKTHNGISFNYLAEASNIGSNLEFIADANPVIATTFNSGGTNSILLVWEGNAVPNGTRQKGLRYWSTTLDITTDLGIYNYLGFNSTSVVNGIISNATTASSHPTLASVGGTTGYNFQLAWQEGTSSIYYKTITYGLTQNTTQNISSGDGFSQNYFPSIIAASDGSGARVSWVGKYWVSNGGGMSKTEALGHWEYKTVFKDPSNQYSFWSFGSNVNTTNIGLNTSSGYIVAWNETGGANKYTRSSTLGGTILPFKISGTTINGQDVQVMPGVTYDNMYGVMLNTQSSPYNFKRSDNITTLGKEENAGNIFNGRTGVISSGDAQFTFTLGDVQVDNVTIEFEPKADTLLIDEKTTLNKYLTTKPFVLTDKSHFTYGIEYGFVDSVLVVDLLKESNKITFKVQLYSDETGEVIGEFTTVTFSKENLYQYKNIGYEVNTNGIGNKKVRLRLIADANFDATYALVQRFNTESVVGLGKGNPSYRKIGYKGSLEVTTYALEQNYPNPFNPSTTIDYQIPKDGYVEIKVYDVLGKEVTTLVNEQKSVGRYSTIFDGAHLASGTYIVRMISRAEGESVKDEFVKTMKVMLVK